MSKDKKTAGKGMKPIVGYNPKNWYDRYDDIDWKNNKKKDTKNERTNRRTEEISGSNVQ